VPQLHVAEFLWA